MSLFLFRKHIVTIYLLGLGLGLFGMAPLSQASAATISIEATLYSRGCDIAPASGQAAQYGRGVIVNAPPYNSRPNCAEYQFHAPSKGLYRLEIEYAAAQSRPVQVVLNRVLVNRGALSATTGCWTPNCQRWTVVGQYHLRAGNNTLLIKRSDVFPHIRALRFLQVSGQNNGGIPPQNKPDRGSKSPYNECLAGKTRGADYPCLDGDDQHWYRGKWVCCDSLR